MKLRKDDPVYYKKKLQEILDDAKNNNIIVLVQVNDKGPRTVDMHFANDVGERTRVVIID